MNKRQEIEVKIDINEMALINEYVKKVERVIDAEMLKRVEHRLNEFGYYRAFGQCEDLSDTWEIFLCSNCHARITIDPGDLYDTNDFKVCPICRCEVVNHD